MKSFIQHFAGCTKVGYSVNLFLIALLAISPSDRLHGQQPAQPSLTVMSYNIRYGTANDGVNHWSKRNGRLVELIRAYNPDLLGTQETLVFQSEFLEEEFPQYESFGVGREDGKRQGEMVTLFFRRDRFKKVDGGHFWMSETPEEPGSKSWDSSLPRMASWVRLKDLHDPKEREILFLNTHLDHIGQRAREESCRLIRQMITRHGERASLIIIGDFNAGESSEPYQVLFAEEALLTFRVIDTFRFVYKQQGEDEGTFSNFEATQTSGARIDWIAVSSDWHIKSASIDRTAHDNRTPSDHFPVLTNLEWKEKATDSPPIESVK